MARLLMLNDKIIQPLRQTKYACKVVTPAYYDPRLFCLAVDKSPFSGLRGLLRVYFAFKYIFRILLNVGNEAKKSNHDMGPLEMIISDSPLLLDATFFY